MNAPADMGVVVVGAGDMGARHAMHWQAAGARVVAVIDRDLERAAACATPLGAAHGADLAPHLTDPDVHVVSVCTPTFLHALFSVPALQAGKHVLCEKPAALTLEDARAMRAAAETSGRELRIGFMRRFDPAFEPLMSFTKRIGEPILGQVTITAGIRPKRLMHDAMANGGPIIDMCCHIFTQWREMFGTQPETVSARGYTFSDGKPEVAKIAQRALDSALITLEYGDGSVGQIQVSWGLPSGIDPVERHSYVGPHGLVIVDWPKRVTLRDAGGITRWASSGVDPWREEIAAFHRELTEGAERRVATIEDGIEALITSLAVLRSVKERRPVSLDEVTTGHGGSLESVERA
jgi:myo-inositol 2-dehydrogenase / D-chiro-inositol 1-dehydrogenase